MSELETTLWIVQWSVEPMPHSQWSVDRFWPFVEVFEAWGDAHKKLESLRDLGYSATFRDIRLWPRGERP